jgi:hypothetical protein
LLLVTGRSDEAIGRKSIKTAYSAHQFQNGISSLTLGQVGLQRPKNYEIDVKFRDTDAKYLAEFSFSAHQMAVESIGRCQA